MEEKTAAVDFTIAKADLTPEAVTDLNAIYEQTLADVTLPTGWTWDAPATSVGNVGNNTFAATSKTYGNGTNNPVVGYEIRPTSSIGFMETAQMQ